MANTATTGIIPTLHASVGYLTAPTDVIAYVLRQVTACPGRTSVLNEPEMVSLRRLEGLYGDDPDKLANIFSGKVREVLTKYFPDSGIVVTATPTKITTSSYNLDIKVQIANASGTDVAISSADIQITKDHKFIITFKGA